MNRKLKTELEEIYSFMAQAYSANWQTRYGETPYMPNFVSQNELDKFLTSFGKFDPVSGHTWAVMLLWTS